MSIFKLSKFPLPAHGLGGTIAAGATMYTPFFWYGLTTGAGSLLALIPGTVSNLGIQINTGQPASGSLVVTLMYTPPGGVEAATSLVVTITSAAAPGFYEDAVNSAGVEKGGFLRIRLVNNAAAASAQIGPVGCVENL